MSAVDGGGTLAPEAFKIRPAPRQPAPALPMPHLDGRSLLSRKAGPLRDNPRIRARLAGRYTGENVGVEQRYAAVTRALVSGIADGTWPVGSNLPGETELAEAFNVSRGTVRVALEKLQGLGLISRRKRAGTKVEARHPVVATYEPTISSVDELSEADWSAVLSANLQTMFHCSRAAAGRMKANGFGRIVTISSGAGRSVSLTGIQAYTTAKAAQLGLTRQLAHELGPFGITVNAIAPGFVLSNPSSRAQWESYGEEGQRALVERIATRRVGEPADIARGVRFFASPAASWISGQVLSIDGGHSLF